MIKLVMNKKQEAILAAIVLVAAIGIFLLYITGAGRTPEPEPAAESEPAPVPMFDIVTEYMQEQSEIDANLFELMQSGEYTLENPLVVTDPYGASPLTALLLFQTENPVKISVHIAGKTEDASLEHTIDSFETDHIIPILGLYPATVNYIEIIAEQQKNQNEQDTPEPVSTGLLIETGAMPEDFPEDVIPPQPDLTPWEPPFYFTFVRKSAFDKNGDYRWYYTGFETQYPSSYAGNGNLLITVGEVDEGDAVILEADLLGRVINLVPYEESASDITGFDAHHYERNALYN